VVIDPGVHPPPSGAPIDGETDPEVSWRNASVGPPRRPAEAGLRLQPGTLAAGSCPSAGISQNGGPAGRHRDWRLPTTESSVTVLRRGLADFLEEADLSDDERYDLLLATCEAVSNAAEHAGNPSVPFFEVLAEIRDTRVTVIVSDHGRWRNATAGAGTDRGRGLSMMWMLADTTIVAEPHGTTVTIRSSPRHGRHPVAPPDEGGATMPAVVPRSG
jgi:anti-sigma regulatory factor (Ser/Thr protein kinase)